MQARQLLNCRVSAWVPVFEEVTFKTRLIDLPDSFVAYLVEDGVALAEGSAALPTRASPAEFADDEEYQDWDDAEVDQAEASTQADSWPELMQHINSAIAELGGRVVPKLSWSCPKDAVWISSTKSLVCQNAEEVVLLLKSSDRIAHDICHVFDACDGPPASAVRHTLALRRAYALKPEREFRCFVRGHELVGVSQRDIITYYPQLAAQQEELTEIILEFFEQHLEHRFAEPDYVVDLYVATNGKVRIVDFNPPGGPTSPLLFSWEELAYPSLRASRPAVPATQALVLPADGPSSQHEPGRRAVSSTATSSAPSVGSQSRFATGAEAEADAVADHGTAPAGQVQPIDRAEASSSGAAAPSGEPLSHAAAASSPEEASRALIQHAAEPAQAAQQPGANGHHNQSDVLDFRLITEPINMQVGASAYGMPYDLVDRAPGSGVDELMRQAREAEGVFAAMPNEE